MRTEHGKVPGISRRYGKSPTRKQKIPLSTRTGDDDAVATATREAVRRALKGDKAP